MRVKVIKCFENDEWGNHLRSMTTADGKITVEGPSKTLRARLAEALNIPLDELQIIEEGKVFV